MAKRTRCSYEPRRGAGTEPTMRGDTVKAALPFDQRTAVARIRRRLHADSTVAEAPETTGSGAPPPAEAGQ